MLPYRIAKRSFDVLAALCALVLASPLWLLVMAGIKLSSTGPLFYATERVGRGGRVFTVYKFRSMHVYSPERDGNADEGKYIANGKRIFPFGRFLRRSKLDEIPQLVNILAGQMSVVGPRPVPAKTAERNYAGKHRRILDVKPGLACLDSLFDYAHGELFVSDNEEYREKIVPVHTELAALYVDRQSFLLDAHCIFRTLVLMVRIAVLKQRNFPLTRYEREATEIVFGCGSGDRKA